MTRKHFAKLAGAIALSSTFLIAPINAIAHEGHGANTHYHIAMADVAPPRVMLNGEALATSVAPQIRGGVTLVPMRDIFEALGATVVWVPQTREIRARKDDTNIWLQIGNATARVDDTDKPLAEAPIVDKGSTLVPLRFVSEALGADVNWNGSERLVSITTNERVATTPSTGNTEVKGTMTIPNGAVVPVTLDETLSSKEAQVGDMFWATVKSEAAGDSEFPAGTKLRGRVTEVRPFAEASPGIIGVQFFEANLPDGTEIALQGDLISLDDDSVTQSDGRIMAKKGKGGTDLKIVGIGAAAGYVLGRVLGKNELVTGILGAAGGYLYSKNKDKGKEQEAVVEAGTTLGVRLNRSVTYSSAAYSKDRATYLN